PPSSPTACSPVLPSAPRPGRPAATLPTSPASPGRLRPCRPPSRPSTADRARTGSAPPTDATEVVLVQVLGDPVGVVPDLAAKVELTEGLRVGLDPAEDVVVEGLEAFLQARIGELALAHLDGRKSDRRRWPGGSESILV